MRTISATLDLSFAARKRLQQAIRKAGVEIAESRLGITRAKTGLMDRETFVGELDRNIAALQGIRAQFSEE